MISYTYADLFKESNIDKQLIIDYGDGQITNSDIYYESFELTESLCSEEDLTFGCCEASEVKFKINNVFGSLVGKWITISTVLDGNTDIPFQLGKYKVALAEPSGDRQYVEITAYDALYDVLNADMTDWYNSLVFPMTLQEFSDSFLAYFDLEISTLHNVLMNGSMIVEKTLEVEKISGKDIITKICEINGAFGHIGRDGKFQYKRVLSFKLPIHPNIVYAQYPDNSIYPGMTFPNGSFDFANLISLDNIISSQYEEYSTKQINNLVIRNREDEVGFEYGVGAKDNSYIVQDNFLCYGKSTEELYLIARNLYSQISLIDYMPFKAQVVSNPCIEVGDDIKIDAKTEPIYSYMLERKISGIQFLKDDLNTNGKKEREENLNSAKTKIERINRKIRIFQNEIDKLYSEIYDEETGLKSQIEQTSGQITAMVRKGDVSSQLSIELGKILLEGNRIAIRSDYFELTEDGKIKAAGGEFSGKIEISGKVVKYAASYNDSDIERVQGIIQKTISPTISDFEKYDLDGNGAIDLLDYVRVAKLVNGHVKSYEFDTFIKIDPTQSSNILQTSGLAIRPNGIFANNGNFLNLLVENIQTEDDSGNVLTGASGSFTTANGKTVKVTNGIITSIS